MPSRKSEGKSAAGRIPKVVLDTNVLVSSLAFKKRASILKEYLAEDKFILLFSPQIYDEYFEVLARPYFRLTGATLREISDLVTEKGIVVEPMSKLDVIPEDPDDNMFLECAVSGNADFIVSGDSHLLSLHEYEGIPILTILKFTQKFRS